MSEAADPPNPIALDAKAVRKQYALGTNTVQVLKGVDLRVKEGEICAVMGPSGVGKSTLLNCIAGLSLPDGGVIEVLGDDVAAMSDEQRTLLRRRKVGIIYQFFNLVGNLTAEENVLLPFLIEGCEPETGRVQEALGQVGMRERAKHMPSQLSGGEMQLVSIARAIVRRPALLLADEPTGNVNVATGKRIMKLLRDVVSDVGALLMVTHNPDDAARADRVVFMCDGVLVEDAELVGGDLDVKDVHERLQSLGI